MKNYTDEELEKQFKKYYIFINQGILQQKILKSFY